MSKETQQQEAAAVDSRGDLNHYYRPHSLDEMLGDPVALASLEQAIKRRVPQFLLFGPAGTGKTSLAFILARLWGCHPQSIFHADAGQASGKGDLTEVLDNLKKGSLHSRQRALILDECQSLSPAAWRASLITTENPPPDCLIILCTTEIDKVPKAPKSRFHRFQTKNVPVDQITELLTWVADEEKFKISANIDALEYLARACDGCVRESLVYLSQCADVTTVAEAKAILPSVTGDTSAVQELAQIFLNEKRPSFGQAIGLVQELPDGSYEDYRIQLVNYMGGVIRKQKNPNATMERAAFVLKFFQKPFHPATARAEFTNAIMYAVLDDGS